MSMFVCDTFAPWMGLGVCTEVFKPRYWLVAIMCHRVIDQTGGSILVNWCKSFSMLKYGECSIYWFGKFCIKLRITMTLYLNFVIEKVKTKIYSCYGYWILCVHGFYTSVQLARVLMKERFVGLYTIISHAFTAGKWLFLNDFKK